MKAVIFILTAALAFLIAAKLSQKARSGKIFVAGISSEGIEDEEGRRAYESMIAEAESNSELDEDSFDDYFSFIAENADPNAPDQAILYDEERNLFIISAGIVARIAYGDKELKEYMMNLFDNHPYSRILIDNFGARSA